MEPQLDTLLSYLKYLQIHRFNNFSQLPDDQAEQLKAYLSKCSKELSLISEDQKPLLESFVRGHSNLFPYLDVANPICGEDLVEKSCSQKTASLMGLPFFIEISPVWLKLQDLSAEASIEFMDWCWQLNPSSFVSFLLEILEGEDTSLKEKSISWIVQALGLDNKILLEFIKHSCGRLRDICAGISELSYAFSTALTEALDKEEFRYEPNLSNLKKHLEGFRYAGLIPSKLIP